MVAANLLMALTFRLQHMQIVEGRLDVDQEMRSLCEAMSSLYEFADQLEAMYKNQQELASTVVEVVKQVLYQTIECALFIQEYCGKGFAGTAYYISTSSSSNNFRRTRYISPRETQGQGVQRRVHHPR